MTSRAHAKPSHAVSRAFVNTGAANVKAIAADLEGNLELPITGQQTIDDYKETKAAALEEGHDVAEAVKRAIKKMKRAIGDDIDDEDAKERARVCPAGAPLRQGQFIFGQWSQKLCMEALMFVSEDLDPQVLRALSAESLRQCLEVAFDVRCFGDAKDRVGIVNQKTLFESLKRVYESRGQPLDVDALALIQDEFGKYRWIDHEGRMYQGTPYAIEQDPVAKTVFILSTMHANAASPRTLSRMSPAQEMLWTKIVEMKLYTMKKFQDSPSRRRPKMRRSPRSPSSRNSGCEHWASEGTMVGVDLQGD